MGASAAGSPTDHGEVSRFTRVRPGRSGLSQGLETARPHRAPTRGSPRRGAQAGPPARRRAGPDAARRASQLQIAQAKVIAIESLLTELSDLIARHARATSGQTVQDVATAVAAEIKDEAAGGSRAVDAPEPPSPSASSSRSGRGGGRPSLRRPGPDDGRAADRLGRGGRRDRCRRLGGDRHAAAGTAITVRAVVRRPRAHLVPRSTRPVRRPSPRRPAEPEPKPAPAAHRACAETDPRAETDCCAGAGARA